jgi:hypothetical protein
MFTNKFVFDGAQVHLLIRIPHRYANGQKFVLFMFFKVRSS